MHDPQNLDSVWISAEEIRHELQKTPYQFCRLLEQKKLETDRHEDFLLSQESYSDNPFFKTSDINSLRVHIISYQSYCSKRLIDSEILKWFPFPHDPQKRAKYCNDAKNAGKKHNLGIEDKVPNLLPWIENQKNLSPMEWIPAEKIRQQLTISPANFCKLLNSCILETNREEARDMHYLEGNTSPFFSSSQIASLSIHHNSYREYCEKNGLSTLHIPTGGEKTKSNEFIEQAVETNHHQQLTNPPAPRTHTTSKPATNKDYSKRMPNIVGAVLAIKTDWDKSRQDSPKRKEGYTDSELTSITKESGLSRELLRCLKSALAAHGIKIYPKSSGPRKTN